MPYFQEPNQRKYKYELTSNQQFNYENMSSDSREVFDVLREVGAKFVYCRYNGGGDEGFAHFDQVELEDGTIGLNVKPQLAASSLGSKTSDYLRSYYHIQEPSPEQRVDFFLELFADN